MILALKSNKIYYKISRKYLLSKIKSIFFGAPSFIQKNARSSSGCLDNSSSERRIYWYWVIKCCNKMWIPLYHIDAPLSLSEFMQEKVREAHNIENFFQCLSEMLKFPTGVSVWVLRETRITLTMHTFSPVSHFCLFFTFFPPGFSLFFLPFSLSKSFARSLTGAVCWW